MGIERHPVALSERDKQSFIETGLAMGGYACSDLDTPEPQCETVVAIDMESLHAEVVQCDKDIMDALARRFLATDAIGELKKQEGAPIRNQSQELRVLELIKELASGPNLHVKFVTEIWETILTHSRLRQQLVQRGHTLERNEL